MRTTTENGTPSRHTATSGPGGSAGALSVDAVAKTYVTRTGEEVEALQTTSFRTSPAEFVGLVGPSGCGKTTLLKICAGLVSPTTGQIRLGTGDERRPQDLGMVFQSAVMLPWRTVLENVMLPADVFGLDKAEARDRARTLLQLMRLEQVESNYPVELSGGMQQRVSIARALLADPPIIFMDEPFGALDAMTREELNMQLQEVQRSQHKTVLFVTHNIQEAVLLSDRVLVMSPGPGRIVADIEIPLPRPRSPEHYLKDEFKQLEWDIRQLLNQKS